MRYKQFNRETVLKQSFLEISGVTRKNGEKSFESDFSGYMGIGPAGSGDDNSNPKENYLAQLKD